MSEVSSGCRRLRWPVSNTPSNKPPQNSMFSKGSAFVDGCIVPVEDARLPLLDWGFLRSDACQETISVWDGKFFRLQDHLTRFRRSTERLRMNYQPLSLEEIRHVVHELVAVSAFDNAYVQIIMTRGRPPIGSRDLRQCINRFQAFCIPYVWIATPSMQQQGLKLHVSQRVRVPVESVDPMVKHYHWLDFEMGLFEAYDLNTDTVCLVDFEGNITEGPGFNIFAVIDGKLTTPDRGVLDGMTRRTVIELAEDMQIKATQAPVSAAALYGANEVFLTTTAGGIIPVTSIDGRPVGAGLIGGVTASLHEAYWARRSEGWHAEPVNYTTAQPSVS
jgi:branched-chain amino acid aminotransferase